MGCKFTVKGKSYAFPSVKDLVAASALIHKAYNNGETLPDKLAHVYYDEFTGEELGRFEVQRYVEGTFHIWMIKDWVLYTRAQFNNEQAVA